MIHEPSTLAIVVFFAFVGATLGLSSFLGRKAKSSQGFFAAHGQIPWFVNGIAFAGDYLSAASFLGICGMIAFFGYDGFLYSIGYLAGWVVALFVIAEPMKRLGKFTFADALDSKFGSRGIKLAAGVSTLAVSIFYLIPQMVGAGVLIQPLLGFPHWAGVLIVGATVIVIVVTAGMVSTTWVQFLKGSLLVVFSTVLVGMILARGFEAEPPNDLVIEEGWTSYPPLISPEEAAARSDSPFHVLGPFDKSIPPERWDFDGMLSDMEVVPSEGGWKDKPYLRLGTVSTEPDVDFGRVTVWRMVAGEQPDQVFLHECQTETTTADGKTLINGLPKGKGDGEATLKPVGRISKLPDGIEETGPLGPLEFFRVLQQSVVILWGNETINEANGDVTKVYFPKPTPGSQVLRPGEHPDFKGIRGDRFLDKLNFLSLMLALFCGTASLPHILIRYYTVKDGAAARKSTIVGIAAIGFFYVLTLYLGLGAMTSGALDVTNSNMAAPLLARSMSEWLFAVISAIAFTTVLGTVSGLILASSGAVAHDLVNTLRKVKLTDHEQVRIAKIASVVVGAIAIVLGIVFKNLNVSYLVGWAFSVAASANLPALIMLLFWKGTTRQGIIAAILVGMTSSLGWIMLSGDTFEKVFGLPADSALVPFSQPGIVTIPLGFLTLIVVSLMTKKPAAKSI